MWREDSLRLNGCYPVGPRGDNLRLEVAILGIIARPRTFSLSIEVFPKEIIIVSKPEVLVELVSHTASEYKCGGKFNSKSIRNIQNQMFRKRGQLR